MKNENSLVIVKGDKLFVGTWDLSQGFGIEHRVLTKLVKKYKSEFDEFGFVASQVQRMTGKKGEQINEFLLTEEQSAFLVMLLKNNPKVLGFKKFLTKEFYRQRRLIQKLIVQRQNAEWEEKRKAGKIDRRVETDTIKEFIEYARNQNSQNAPKYYMAISKMENQALFLNLIEIQYPNLRDVVNSISLTKLQIADRIVAKALKEGMEKRMFYKDIFQLAKSRVESFADLIGRDEILIEQQKVIQ